MRPSEIALLLPEIYRAQSGSGTVLDAALEVMSALHGSLEEAIADPARLIDPRRAPDRMIDALAGWVGLSRYLDQPGDGGISDSPHPGDLRELAVLGAELGRRRGSAATLTRFLETATGIAGFRIDEDAQRPFHFSVTLPPGAQNRRDLILRIIAGEKPAFTTFDLIPPDPEPAPQPDT